MVFLLLLLCQHLDTFVCALALFVYSSTQTSFFTISFFSLAFFLRSISAADQNSCRRKKESCAKRERRNLKWNEIKYQKQRSSVFFFSIALIVRIKEIFFSFRCVCVYDRHHLILNPLSSFVLGQRHELANIIIFFKWKKCRFYNVN